MDRRTLLRTGLSASAAAALASTAGCAPWTSGSKRAGEFRVEPTEDGIRCALEAAAKTQGEDFRYAYAQVCERWARGRSRQGASCAVGDVADEADMPVLGTRGTLSESLDAIPFGDMVACAGSAPGWGATMIRLSTAITAVSGPEGVRIDGRPSAYRETFLRAPSVEQLWDEAHEMGSGAITGLSLHRDAAAVRFAGDFGFKRALASAGTGVDGPLTFGRFTLYGEVGAAAVPSTVTGAQIVAAMDRRMRWAHRSWTDLSSIQLLDSDSIGARETGPGLPATPTTGLPTARHAGAGDAVLVLHFEAANTRLVVFVDPVLERRAHGS
ncbi:hypothetical protein GSY69_02285 [Brevibacterium sp. 5221]|uniref:Lipoprotein n=1 Tax=Brevibacterium rongguiense TaxID=2695267 RepID=A0A6N9H457_9MICO|nr:hypothetical protein [Brevibacterium rongguiense]MYM18838.1 hypothetical protein [Brevibacterium rongguiense]